LGIIHGVIKVSERGIVSFMPASAWGESLMHARAGVKEIKMDTPLKITVILYDIFQG
jgi:hypothetical protein